jgi:hypothetical protein
MGRNVFTLEEMAIATTVAEEVASPKRTKKSRPTVV